MRSRKHLTRPRHSRPLALLFLALVAPPSARAADDERDETERWVPSASLALGVMSQKAAGTVASSDVLGPAISGTTQPLRPPADGRNSLLSATFGGTLELMTPRFLDGWGRPRVYGRIGFDAAFGFDRNLAGEGSPGPFVFPDLPNIGNKPDVVIEGQGSRTRAKTEHFLLSAGAGVAFTVDLGDRRIRIKPSIEYLREEIAIQGIVHRAVAINRPSRNEDDFRYISLTSDRTETYHGVGPGLEIEADTQRAGPFMLTVYASGQGYSFFGDRRIAFSAENEYGERADWTFEKQEWGWGMRLGLRFRWIPE